MTMNEKGVKANVWGVSIVYRMSGKIMGVLVEVSIQR